MEHFGTFSKLFLASFDPDKYRCSLLDIEHIFIFTSVRCGFLFFTISMEINDVDVVKCLQEVPPHTSESWVIEIAMIGYKS